MRLGDKRKLAHASAFAISNLGFTRMLKTGFVCPFLYCHGCPFAFFGCPIGGLQHFIMYGQFPFYIMGWLGIYAILFGRAFCGWACPFGALHDLLGRGKAKTRLRGESFWFTKYVMLFLTLILAWIMLDTVFCKFCPSGSLFASIPYTVLTPNPVLGIYFRVHMITLLLAVALALVVSRFWCRYLCPLGAFYSVFNKFNLFTIRYEEEKCEKCLACLEVCPMGIDEMEAIGASTNCILCGRCVEECSAGALSFGLNSKRGKT